MKRLISLLTLLVSFAAANAKCDWSTLKLQQWNQGTLYKWYVTGKVLDDTCVDYMYLIYDVQTKKIDTMNSYRGICEVQFNKKGKYKMYLKVWNKCEKCDTSLMREVNIIYFPKCSFVYGLRSSTGTSCTDSIVGEMTWGPWSQVHDTCWEWYSYIWNGPMLDSLSQHDWDSMSDYQLYNYYDFNDSDLIWYKGPGNDARRIALKFPHDGHYLIATQWYNKCLDQDTFFFTRITVETCETTTTKLLVPTVNAIRVFPNPADNLVQITLTTPTKNPMMTYEVFDSKGQVVNTGRITNNIAINTTNWTNGVYVIKIGRLTQKFIVRH